MDLPEKKPEHRGLDMVFVQCRYLRTVEVLYLYRLLLPTHVNKGKKRKNENREKISSLAEETL